MVPPSLTRALCLVALVAVSLPTAAAETPVRIAALRTLEVSGEVSGDVFVLGGDLLLKPGAKVHGHAIALLGRVDAAPDATVDGHILAVESLANLRLHGDDMADLPQLDAAVRILSSGGWLVVTTALAFLFPARMRRGSVLLRGQPLRTSLLGVLLTLTLFSSLVAVLGLGTTLGAMLGAALMMAFLVLKAVGLTVCGGVLGGAFVARSSARRLPFSFAVFAGVGCLLLLRVLPLIGGALWTVASVVALGAGLLSLALASRQALLDLGAEPGSPHRS